MSDIYGVISVERGGKTVQASRTGDKWGSATLSVKAANGGDWTFKINADPDGFDVSMIPKRWRDAVASPDSEWEDVAEVNLAEGVSDEKTS